MPVKMSFSDQLLMLPSDSPCCTANDKSGASLHPNGTDLSDSLLLLFNDFICYRYNSVA